MFAYSAQTADPLNDRNILHKRPFHFDAAQDATT